MHVRLRPDPRTRGLAYDQDYLVLAMTINASADHSGEIAFWLLDEEGFPAMVHGRDVAIVEATIPSEWVVESSYDTVSIGAPAMARGDFWNQFADDRGPNDDHRWVQPIYRIEVERLVAEIGNDFDRAAFAEMPHWVDKSIETTPPEI